MNLEEAQEYIRKNYPIGSIVECALDKDDSQEIKDHDFEKDWWYFSLEDNIIVYRRDPGLSSTYILYSDERARIYERARILDSSLPIELYPSIS